jgi:hypothetical protein
VINIEPFKYVTDEGRIAGTENGFPVVNLCVATCGSSCPMSANIKRFEVFTAVRIQFDVLLSCDAV